MQQLMLRQQAACSNGSSDAGRRLSNNCNSSSGEPGSKSRRVQSPPVGAIPVSSLNLPHPVGAIPLFPTLMGGQGLALTAGNHLVSQNPLLASQLNRPPGNLPGNSDQRSESDSSEERVNGNHLSDGLFANSGAHRLPSRTVNMPGRSFAISYVTLAAENNPVLVSFFIVFVLVRTFTNSRSSYY